MSKVMSKPDISTHVSHGVAVKASASTRVAVRELMEDSVVLGGIELC